MPKRYDRSRGTKLVSSCFRTSFSPISTRLVVSQKQKQRWCRITTRWAPRNFSGEGCTASTTIPGSVHSWNTRACRSCLFSKVHNTGCIFSHILPMDWPSSRLHPSLFMYFSKKFRHSHSPFYEHNIEKIPLLKQVWSHSCCTYPSKELLYNSKFEMKIADLGKKLLVWLTEKKTEKFKWKLGNWFESVERKSTVECSSSSANLFASSFSICRWH